jgi:uncharacterized protein YdeI (YjbR/CyaY-like superfamily)
MTLETPPNRIEITSQAALWAWLDDNHIGSSVWLVTWKAAHRDKYVSRDEVLDALIAYGWIDGRRMKLDDNRTMQLIAPRAQQAWARSYKDRAEKLIAEGRMLPAGLAALENGKQSGRWMASDPVDDLQVPDDLRAALRASGATTESCFDNAAPSYRRNVLRFIVQAKRPETRAKRIATVVGYAANGQRVPHY